MNKTGNWAACIKQNKTGKDIISFTCNNQYIGKFLEQNDYHIKSGASADKILSKIPKKMQHYWWRGYFDGDGCVQISKQRKQCGQCSISITSCYDQNWSFINLLEAKTNIKFNIRKYIRKDIYSKSSQITTSGRINCLKFAHYIYKDYGNDKIGFVRKYDKFRQIIISIINAINSSKTIKPQWLEPKLNLHKKINYWKKVLFN